MMRPVGCYVQNISALQAAQNWNDLSERYASFVDKSAAAI